MRRKSILTTLILIIVYILISRANVSKHIRSSIDLGNVVNSGSEEITVNTEEDEKAKAAREKIESVGDSIGSFFSSTLSKVERSKVSASVDTSDTPDGNDVAITVQALEKARLLYVVDGDTIVVDLNGVEKKIRFIGIDTPESVHEDESRNTIYGTYASDYTKSLLEGVEYVYLQYDEEKEDQYGRTLAYVWLDDNVDVTNDSDIASKMLNAILVEDGYAMNKVFAPNDAYADKLNAFREQAEDSSEGLWGFKGFRDLWK